MDVQLSLDGCAFFQCLEQGVFQLIHAAASRTTSDGVVIFGTGWLPKMT